MVLKDPGPLQLQSGISDLYSLLPTMTTDRHGESLIITIQSDMKVLHITLWLTERLGTRIGMPRRNHCLTSKGEQSKADLSHAMLYPPTVAFFLCQFNYEGSCSVKPCACGIVHVGFILPSSVLAHCVYIVKGELWRKVALYRWCLSEARP